jgi:hypothetical protein
MKGVRSRFHVLRSLTHFWRFRGRRVSFSCFVIPDSFSAVPRASSLVFMCCAPKLIFGSSRVSGPVFMFCAPENISASPMALGPIFMFCAPGLVFDSFEGSGSRFRVLRSRTRFRRFRGSRVPFSSFARPDSLSVVPRASGSF